MGSAQVDQSQHPGSMPAIRFSGEIASSADVGTGALTGRRKHEPFVVTRELDEASPQLFQAAATNETLNVLVELPTVGQDGKETVFYTITLTNATVSDYRMYTAPLPEGGSNIFELEDVAFSFQQIAVKHCVAGTIASTDTAGSRVSVAGAGPAAAGSATSLAPTRMPARYGSIAPVTALTGAAPPPGGYSGGGPPGSGLPKEAP